MGRTNLMYVPSVWDCGIRESDSGALSFVRFLKSEVPKSGPPDNDP